ncbi:MAG: excinuclease ABC subunit UvrC, partial [bacterium]|nr:excinuclease ABC subunit UvrC [bacterium]
MEMKEKLVNLPQKPGVYLFKDEEGEVLYVGKAKNLKNRVRTYFQKGHEREARINLMIAEIADLDYTIVSTETESLILENNFIKQYRPRYNVRLRDDKNYQFIKIDYETEIPQIYTTRNITSSNSPSRGGGSKSKYYGPYTSGLSVRHTMKLLRRIFHLCSNKKVSSRPCFYYHLGRCPGVCVGQVSLTSYRESFRAIEKFLQNKQNEVLQNLQKKMSAAASGRKFEKAALLRDNIKSLKQIWEKQKIIFVKPNNEDYLSLFQSDGQSIVNLFRVRLGRIIHQEIFELKNPQQAKPDEVIKS